PRSHQLASAQRCGHANHVGVNLQAASCSECTQSRLTGDALSLEQAVLGLASSQMQLHDFEVVSQTEVVGPDVFGVGAGDRALNNTRIRVHSVRTSNDIGGSLHAIIRQSHSQRAVSVTQTSGPGLAVQVIVVETALVGVPVLRTVSVERVANTKLEAREIRGLVHDHVVETGGVSCRERGTHVGLVEAQTERIDSAEVLGSDVGLTAEVDLTPGVATQTERSVTTEQATALSGVTGVETEATFELEHGLQAVTQIFSALQTPAVTRL